MTTDITRTVTIDPDTLAAVPVQPARSYDPSREPVRLLADRPERWVAYQRRGNAGRTDRGISWAEAMASIEADARADGARSDLGAGALDRLAVDFDAAGLVHVAKTEIRNGRLVPASQPIPLRAQAWRQLAARADAPAGYLARLPATLARACMMHGITTSGSDKTGLIRMARGEARAIVSGGYGLMDDRTVLSIVGEELDRRGVLSGARVVALAVGARTVLRLALPAMAGDAMGRPGDTLIPMLDVRNGELGNGSGEVRGGVYRLVCTNGAIAPIGAEDVRRIRHVGSADRLAESLRDAVPAALDAAMNTTDLLRAATDRIVGAAGDAFAGLRLFGATAAAVRAAEDVFATERGFTLPADTRGRRTVLDHIADATAWEVVNALTDAAQRVETTDARLDAEGAAGAYLRRTMGA